MARWLFTMPVEREWVRVKHPRMYGLLLLGNLLFLWNLLLGNLLFSSRKTLSFLVPITHLQSQLPVQTPSKPLHLLLLRQTPITSSHAQIKTKTITRKLWCIFERSRRNECFWKRSRSPRCHESGQLLEERASSSVHLLLWRNWSYRGVTASTTRGKSIKNCSFVRVPAMLYSLRWACFFPKAICIFIYIV